MGRQEIAVGDPGVDLQAGVIEIAQGLVEQFVAHTPVEALDEAVRQRRIDVDLRAP